MEKTMGEMIGGIFEITRPAGMLGNPVGTIGYVFNQYKDYDDPNEIGVQIIFPNGDYDGFSFHEQSLWLKCIGHDRRYEGYQFKSVMQLYKDFNSGYWKWE
jgi:hypothetical protein